MMPFLPRRCPPPPCQAHAAIGLVAQRALHGTALDLPLERLFDDRPNLVFFIKDRASRYLAVNRALVERCAFSISPRRSS